MEEVALNPGQSDAANMRRHATKVICLRPAFEAGSLSDHEQIGDVGERLPPSVESEDSIADLESDDRSAT